MTSEYVRLSDVGCADDPNAPLIEVVAISSQPDDSLRRIKEVLIQIASATNESEWLNDEEWTRRLPKWFVQSFVGRSLEELKANQDLWGYGSWLDAMRYRGWQWWNATLAGNDSWTVVLLRDEDVYSLDPFLYLARTSGAKSFRIAER